MNQLPFQTSAWYKALTLSERIASLGKIETLNIKTNAELAQRRIKHWREISPFSQDTYWNQRLKLDSLTEHKFYCLLGEQIESVHSRFSLPPTWLAEIEQAYTNFASSDTYTFSPPEMLTGEEITGFLYAVEPLISQGCQQLQEEVQNLVKGQIHLPFDPNTVIEILVANLPDQLLWMLNRTMVLELNVARLQGLLQGNTPEERFNSFLKILRQQDQVLIMFQEYPVLARQIKICIDNWVTFNLEFIQHLCADWRAIQSTFSPDNEPGLLIELQGNAGDSHKGGRSVLIAKFSSGLQVVYKPRSLAVDIHFQQLLTWINDRGDHPPFPTLKVLDRNAYGWIEFVNASGCNNLEEVRRFYERQGGYLALLYALEATDFHCENLIAAGENPILIDLESLFHPRFERVDIAKSALIAHKKMAYSVLNIGLLPHRFWTNADYEGIDLSGLGSVEGQLTPYLAPYWDGQGTDKMQLKRKRMEMPGDQNRPTLKGKEVNVLDYKDSLLTGFTNIYELLLKYRDELLAENSPLAHFAEDEVRVIIRSTYTYSSLLAESFHPDVLRDALDRDRLFERLWLDIEQEPYLSKIIAAERQDLWQGDVPFFTTHPNSPHIWSSSGQQITNFCQESGMDLVKRRFQQLSKADLTQQSWFILASLTTSVTLDEQASWPSYHLREPQHSISSQQLLAAAQKVGNCLETLALCSEEDAAWIGLNLVDDKRWTLIPLGMDLYEGLPGIIIFLAYLGHITQENRYTNLAKAALSSLQHQIEIRQELIASIGGFEGWGGIIYTLTQLSMIWDDSELLAQAESLVTLISSLISQDEQFDIMSGSAGCIASLISLYRCHPSQSTLTAAIQCGDRLLDRAQSMKSGIGWFLKHTGVKPLTGFSHGNAGIAWSLLELATITGQERFRSAALEAIAYERSLFCSEVGNWPDLRQLTETVLGEKDSQPNCMTAWCHGAPGIGLARLRSLAHLDNAEIRAEIDTALQTTLKQGFGSNHSLCHGDLGNLELLLQASLTLKDSYWKTEVERFTAIILESIDRHGWLCGVPLGVETPGLMTGLAGIGYQLLRLAQPDCVPSILMLEPPKLGNKVLAKFTEAVKS